MAIQKFALRGPLLNSTEYPNSSRYDNSFIYIKDALIILDGNEILEFGPANSLLHKLSDIKLIKLNRKCRIIKSVSQV